LAAVGGITPMNGALLGALKHGKHARFTAGHCRQILAVGGEPVRRLALSGPVELPVEIGAGRGGRVSWVTLESSPQAHRLFSPSRFLQTTFVE